MKRSIGVFGITLLAIFMAHSVLAADMTGEEIVKKMGNINFSEDAILKVKMTLIDKTGKTRERALLMRGKKEKDGLAKSVITFLAPADVKGVKFLIIQVKDKDDIQKLYLPALKRIRQISSNQKSDSFMGTDFTYNDMQSRKAEDGVHTRLADESMDGVDCYKVQTIPKPDVQVDYSKLIYWVRKDNMMPVKAMFWDKEGKLLKEMTIRNHERADDGNWIARYSKMTNMQTGHATELQIVEYKVNAGVDESYFTEQFLLDEAKP